MSAPEEIDLQLLRKDGEDPEGESCTEGEKPVKQPDAAVKAKGSVDHVVTSRWKKIGLSLVTLLSYTFLYAAMSDVTAFYAILVR